MTTIFLAQAETRVNTTTALDQRSPALAELTDGSYVVSWTGSTANGLAGIYAQRFDAQGQALGAQVTVNTPATGTAKDSDVAPLANGGYVVSWNVDQTSGFKFSTHAQRLTATGAKVGGDTSISANATYQQAVSQVGLWNGGYVVVWESNNAQPPTANGYGIHAVLADSAGVVSPQDIRVNLTLLLDQLDPSLATYPTVNGGSTGFVVAFETPDSAGYGIVARTFNASATGAAAEFQVNTSQAGEQRDPATAVLANGDLVIAWSSTGQDGSGDGVYLQRFTAAGAKIGQETLVNTTTTNDQAHAHVAAMTDGGYVVVWTSVGQDGSGSGVYFQRYSAGGGPLGPETLVNDFTAGDQHEPAITALGAGFVISWTSVGQDGSGAGVYQKVYLPVEQTLLGGSADSFTGVSGADSIDGGDGNDVLNGAAGADTIVGGLGDDNINGGSGNSYLRGNEGNDQITGGDSFDDINGNQGDDTCTGGLGTDWVVGGKDNDSLFGDAGDDIVYGNIGNDTCDGGSGNDVVRGGQNDDILTGGTGDDWLSGDRGNDTITGGAGADIFHSFSGAGVDRVTDFSLSQGDRVLLDAGTSYTILRTAGDTVLDFGNGDQLILAGVNVTAPDASWISYI
jgi:Ca2+-binding RTX toxin-like protein